VTLRRSGLLSHERFTINSNSHTLRIPIKDEYAPNIHVQVDLVGATWRNDEEGHQQQQLPKRPAFASGELKLSNPPLRRKLAVTATPRDKSMELGGVTAVDIVVRDAAGKPVRGSEVALVVVDEAVLALTKYELADPLAGFYRSREAETRDQHSRENVLLVENQELMGMLRSPFEKLPLLARLAEPDTIRLATQFVGDQTDWLSVMDSAPETQIRMRLNFNPLATFAPTVLTDAAGRATVQIKLPDNLTRYRVMAVAVAGEKQFGKGESAITALPARRNLTLSKEGRGRLYYRIGMNYSPENLQLKPADQGFTVTRAYEAVDNPNDVRREEDGTWRVKAGAKVRVRLTMVAPARHYHVALVDPLPAGFEALNPELAITGHIPQDPNDQMKKWLWAWQWFEHQNMRDERVEAFTSLLWEGVYNYSYVARATTPGVFVVPPSKAEEMYHPETFGRGATDRVVIE
jgi:uncharacterized protein YfaS (alpha-2-macroglobulin family)